MFTLGTLRTISALQCNIDSCSHCTGTTFETEQKPIRYIVNIALISRNFFAPVDFDKRNMAALNWCIFRENIGSSVIIFNLHQIKQGNFFETPGRL